MTATTIVSVTGSSSELSCLGCFSQVAVAGWRAPTAYQNVSISAEVGASAGGDIFAYLVTQIGVGATAASEIASTIISPATLDEADVFFSGLDLPADTYFLVLTGSSTTSQYWYSYDSPVVVADSGVTDLVGGIANDFSGNSSSLYPPASVFDYSSPMALSMIVSGTPTSAAPEPVTPLLACTGLFFVWLKYRSGRGAAVAA